MDRTAWKLRSFNRRRARFGEDLCSLVTSVSTPDGFGGSTDTPTTIATGILCFYEAFKSPMQMSVGGAALTSLMHKITMEATAATKSIQSDYQIVVAARDDKPSLTFERPVTLDGSYTPLVEVAAVLGESAGVAIGAVVSGAGTIPANGTYTIRGTSSGKPYYNILGQPDDDVQYAVVWNGQIPNTWGIQDGAGDALYSSSDAVAFPWLAMTWTVAAGSLPVPMVTQA